ncbi:MAG TPA: SDR family oxidoreductase, partial [Chryseolinea sp.]|nr:SDR family oxidoreductase [Chryseolinea sp.]
MEKNGRIFHNQVAIVTGAGQGIGLAICQSLASQGAAVVLNDVEQSLAEEATESILREGGRCVAYAGDASSVEFIREMVAEAVRQFGKVDIAIANAGITLYGEFLDYRKEDLMKVLDLNVGGSFFLAQAAALQMKEQKSGGRILFMSSVTGH